MALHLTKKIGGSPIRKNIIANFFGVGVSLLNQIALVPFYIYFWGNELYADWIVLSAITVIFSMSDIGLNTVIQNRFSIKLAEHNINECNELITNNILIVSIIFITSLIITALVVLSCNLVQLFGLHVISNKEAAWILILIVSRIYISMYSGVENAIYRANHKSSRCVYIDQLALLASVLITSIFLIAGFSIVELCWALIIPPLIVILFKNFDSKKYFNYHFSFRYFDKTLLLSLIKPSLAFMSFPIGNAILLQGYTFVVNMFYGADDVVEFNTTRTMCNFMIVLISTINNSVWPEYSIAYGEKDYNRMRNLHSKSITTSLILAFISSLAILILGPFIFKIWTCNKVPFSYPLMSVLLISILFQVLWSSSGITLMATNNHQKMGLVYTISCLISLALAIILTYLGTPLFVMVASMIITHIVMCVYTQKAGLQLTGDNNKDFYNRNCKYLFRDIQKIYN